MDLGLWVDALAALLPSIGLLTLPFILRRGRIAWSDRVLAALFVVMTAQGWAHLIGQAMPPETIGFDLDAVEDTLETVLPLGWLAVVVLLIKGRRVEPE